MTAYRLVSRALKVSAQHKYIAGVHDFIAKVIIPKLTEENSIFLNTLGRKEEWMIWEGADLKRRFYLPKSLFPSLDEVESFLRCECGTYDIKVKLSNNNLKIHGFKFAWKRKPKT